MYPNNVGKLGDLMAVVENNKAQDTIGDIPLSGRTVLKGGKVVDPKHKIEAVKDIVIVGDTIVGVADDIQTEKGDIVINCEGLLVVPGLIDMHLHLGDLFEVSTNPIFEAVQDGVTVALSPGAGNTIMAPALLGAEVDRGVPMNLGVYLGGANVLGSMLSTDELIQALKGELDPAIGGTKMTRNPVALTTAPFTVGIKDHMGHFIMNDENIDKLFEVTSKVGLIYMSHTQDPAHTERLAALSKGRPLHLAHATAAGCGTHAGAAEGMKRVLDVIGGNITGEFVTTHLRADGGNREGLLIHKDAQKLAYDALESKKVDVLISDGQCDATMKGFGDTRDNIPAILELAQMGVLSLMESVATMTINPANLVAKLVDNTFWNQKLGHLGVGALANVTVISESDKLATYTLVNGQIVAFENRAVRRNSGAGGWVSKYGILKRTGVGDLAMFSYKK